MKKLNEYALIAEVVSAVCIVVSLIFVGLQVRQGALETAENSVALRSQVQQAMMETDKDLLLFRAANNTDGADDFYYANALFRSRELYWSQYIAGLLDDDAYMSYMTPFITGSLNDPAFTQIWIDSVNQGFVRSGFVAEIDRLRAALSQAAFDYGQ
jgi:hypothetical protein